MSVLKAKQPLTECSLVLFLNCFGSEAQEIENVVCECFSNELSLTKGM